MSNVFSRSQRLIKFYSELDKIIAVVVLCLGIGFMAVSIGDKRPNGVILSGTLLAPSLVYLLLRNRLTGNTELPQIKPQDPSRFLSHIVFMVSLSLSLWLLWNNLYYRPPLYFVLCSLAAASIVWDIFTLDETRKSPTTIFFLKILALSISIYAGIYYMFPGIFGNDAWWHNQWIQETVSLGHITSGQFSSNTYFIFPIFHLAAATMNLVTGLSIYNSIFITTSVLIAASSIFIFLIGRKLVNTRAGLLAALIVPLTGDTIGMATDVMPTSLGFCFFSAIFYLVFCRDRKRVADVLMIILLSVALIFTHTISALIMLLSLITIFIGTKLYKQISRLPISYGLVSSTLILFFGVTMLVKWMQTSWRPSSGEAFFDPHFRYLVDSLRFGTEFAPTDTLITSTVSPAVSLFNKGGYLLVLGFAIIGALMFLQLKKRSAPGMALVLTAAVLIIIPTGFDLFGSNAILPARWSIFLYVPLSILAAQGLSGISGLIKWNAAKTGLVTLVMLAAIFMMITNYDANTDSPLSFNKARRYGYTQSEITAIRTMAYMGCGFPQTDIYYGSAFAYVLGYDEFEDMIKRKNEVFVLRNYYLHHPEWDKNYVIVIQPLSISGTRESDSKEVVVWDYMNEHEITSQPLIYINQNVKVYEMPQLGMEP